MIVVPDAGPLIYTSGSRGVGVAESIACLGVIVDAYLKYDFVTIEGDGWPRRMFLPIATPRAAAGTAGPQP